MDASVSSVMMPSRTNPLNEFDTKLVPLHDEIPHQLAGQDR